MCFLPNCRYHIILICNIKQLLKQMDAFCFSYQHVDCLCTLFKYRFSGKIVVKSGQLFDNMQRLVHFNHQHKGLDRMPSIAKNRLLIEKHEKHLLSSLQKTKSTQTSRSVSEDRIKQVKKSKFELELIKTVDCFLDGHGNYTSNLVSCQKNLCKLTSFAFPKTFIKKIGGATDTNITPVKNSIAIKNALTKMIVPNVKQTQATDSKINFYPRLLYFPAIDSLMLVTLW